LSDELNDAKRARTFKPHYILSKATGSTWYVYPAREAKTNQIPYEKPHEGGRIRML